MLNIHIMKYYKYLDINTFKVNNFLIKYCNNNLTKPSIFWNNVDTQKFLHECPEFQKLFDPLNITVNKIAITVSTNNSYNDGIHKDHDIKKVRINLPILNCEQSITNFYRSSIVPEKKFLRNGIPYYSINRKDCELVDSFCLDRPAALNIQELHQVVIPTPNILRISCTIRFNENIDYLLSS
jgi:hypothetical protein